MLNSSLVHSAQASPPGATHSSLPSRIAWAALIVATLFVCYFSHLGALGFVGPDEPRYAWIARDMAETGDWITPRLYGKPWFEKPPLYYWCAAFSFKLFGVSEAAARLPSAVAALLATLALAWLALRLYGAETARWLLLLLPTSVAMIGFSHAASTDMLFSFALTLALVAAGIVLRLVPPVPSQSSAFFTSSVSLNSCLFGFFLGLAVLAKGPAALVLSGGAIFFWALFTKRWPDAFRLLHPVAIAAFCLTALPWYILCARRNPDFFRIFIIEHNFERYFTPEFQHIQPFWYYAAVLLIALLPWSALLIWSFVSGIVRLWRTRQISDATLLFLCWSVFCVLFFSISQSKLPGYILPAIPTVAFLLAHATLKWRTKGASQSTLAGALVFALGCSLEGSIASRMRGLNLSASLAARWILGALAAVNVLVGIGILLPEKNRRWQLLAVCAVCPVLLVLLFADRLIPSFFSGDPSGRSIAQELERMGVPMGQLSTHHMNRGRRYSLSFYLHQEIPEWDSLHPSEGFTLEPHKIVSLVHSGALVVSPEPKEIGNTGYFLYEVRRRSVGGAPRSGEVK